MPRAARDKRPSWFKLFLHTKPVIDAVSDEDAGRALKAALHYFDTGITVEPDGSAKIAYALLKQAVDEANADYARNIENGRKGGRPPKPPVTPGYPPSPTVTEEERDGEVEEDGEGDGEDILISVGGNAAAARNPVSNYCQYRGYDQSVYFGATPDRIEEADRIAAEVFKHFGGRKPTKADKAQVFQCIYENGTDGSGNWTVSYPKNKIDLLIYAFEQAANAGCPGNWRYIDGVLANLSRRGITDLGQAEDYDDRR